MSKQRRAWLAVIAGSALVLVGIAVLLWMPTSGASFGWFAYAPLSDSVFTPGFMFLDPTHRWAVVLAIVGLIVASGAAGYLVGRRTK